MSVPEEYSCKEIDEIVVEGEQIEIVFLRICLCVDEIDAYGEGEEKHHRRVLLAQPPEQRIEKHKPH